MLGAQRIFQVMVRPADAARRGLFFSSQAEAMQKRTGFLHYFGWGIVCVV
jgi:hypothetical protein